MTKLVTRSRLVALAGASCAALALGYGIVRVRAQALASPPLYYAGTLLSNGSAVSGTHTFSLALYDAEVGGGSACPEAVHSGVNLSASSGHFRLALHADCAAALQAGSDLWVEVKVDGIVVGRSGLGSVPHAVQAAHATSADTATASTHATSADSATTATTASAATTADQVPWSGITGTKLDGSGTAAAAAHADHHHDTGSLAPTIPPGTVVAYAGDTEPAGWLFCNGREIDRIQYAALFAAIKVAHGGGDGSSTFNLPDYRGRFLRGTDKVQGMAANRDPDKALRTAMATGGAVGDAVGSVQESAFQRHLHTVYAKWVMITASQNASGPASGIYSGQVFHENTGFLYMDPAGGSLGETRPVNANVNYIIKY